MKILFVQLPLIDHSYNYIYGNIQYAPSLLIAYIKNKIDKNIEVEILPSFLTNFASDSIIIKYIDKINPDILCFSNYLWNVERHLYITENIKNLNKKVKVIFGGPEISDGSVVFSNNNSFVDMFYSGEGEWFFNNFFNNFEYLSENSEFINGNYLIKQPIDNSTDVDDIFEPYTNNYLDIMPDGSIFLELTRGCPFKCTYCYYSKNNPKLREKEICVLLYALSNNLSKFLSEIYILSPTFNKTKDFLNNLKLIKEKNINKIKLHTEMRAEGIDLETAKLIKDSGFHSLEVGLQTLNKESLKEIGRHGNIEKELDGIKNLAKAGIDLKIGIIPGLPKDTPGDFIKTIDKLLDLSFEDFIEFYPLMMLPGTKIRSESKKYNYEFQNEPPYFIISNDNFEFEDIYHIQKYIEEKTGFYNSKRVIPDFVNIYYSKLNNLSFFNGDIISNWNFDLYKNIIETNIYSFIIDIKNIESISKGLNILFPSDYNNNQLFNLIFKSIFSLNEQILEEFLLNYDLNSFYKRLHLYDEWAYSNRIRFYHLTEDLNFYLNIFDNYELVEPILKITTNNIDNLISKYVDNDYGILLTKGIISNYSDFFIENYAEKPELISFEDKEDYYYFQEHLDFN